MDTNIEIFSGSMGKAAFKQAIAIDTKASLILLLSFLVTGLPIGLATGAIIYAVSYTSLGLFSAALLALGFITPPWTTIIGFGALAAALTTSGVFVGKMINTKRRGPAPLVHIKGPIDTLGAYVVKIVFLPLFGMISIKAGEDNQNYLKKKMGAWGYSDRYIQYIWDEYSSLFSRDRLDGIKAEIIGMSNKIGNTSIIKNNTDVKQLHGKVVDFCDEFIRNLGQNDPDRAMFLDWLKVTLAF
jgi:hypothetical protein